MDKRVRVRVLLENRPSEELLSEHGLSLWIESDGMSTLFDTGQSPLFTENADRMGIGIESADRIVLSHGHYDHTGGLAAACERNRNADIYLGEQARKTRYSLKTPGNPREIGMPAATKTALQEIATRCRWVRGVTQLSDSMWLTGPIPRTSTFENAGGEFFLDQEGVVSDVIPDDQALWISTVDGLMVILGCCHAGVINTLDYIRSVSGERRVLGLIGGLHLGNAEDSRIEMTIDYLKGLDLRILAPCHCTGNRAEDAFKTEFTAAYRTCTTGTEISF